MKLARLSLTDFRSYPQVELDLDPGVSVLVGLNGQGKTNLVEAIWYVATLSSHRVASEAPLIRTGAGRAVVRTVIEREDRDMLVELELVPGGSNRARVNRAPLSRPREVLGLLRTVLFAPEDIALVKGDPAERRRFLDELLVARAPRLAGVRSDYDRVLRQRSALLRSAGPLARGGRGGQRGRTSGGTQRGELPTLDVWDVHLARAGAELLAARMELVEALRPLVAKAYDAVSGGAGDARLDYRSSAAAAAQPLPTDRAGLTQLMLEAMEAARPAELERGVSLVGPHRDELVLSLGTLPARGYASHGESWSFALALRLAAYDLLSFDDATSAAGTPVLLLDDVFAELDTGRRERLATLVAPAEQVLVTAAVPADVPEQLRGARYAVSAGSVRRTG